jgi:hypothetical protein
VFFLIVSVNIEAFDFCIAAARMGKSIVRRRGVGGFFAVVSM